ncbi:MAG: sigma 54-interacting transcriptional regulator [Desulfatitalea sp.]|nr:sigma 54-interacting transcriptional regulator [Desulfatitalea sp.]
MTHGEKQGLQIRFETLIIELSAKFINLSVDRIDEEIENGQMLVCEALGLNRSVFMETSGDKFLFTVNHMWVAPGVSKKYPADLTQEPAYWISNFLKGKVFFTSDLEDLPDVFDSHAKQSMRDTGVTSFLVVPLKVGENLIGLVSWESHGFRREWPKALVDRLRLISEVFANALSRKKAEEDLRALKDQLQIDNLYLLDEIKLEHKHHKIVGKSKAIKRVLHQVENVSGTPSTVLILGETGTGKEVVARAIHELSRCRKRPMVKVNCSALPAALIESELFGYEKGAFSGADANKEGRFEVANGSTIFLDEIGDLPLELQPKLLRVLQEGEFEKLGSTKTTQVNTRVIAATNRDLERAVKEGKFRSDLFFRLNIFPILVPPLRERSEDIPLLVKGFVQEFCESMGKAIDTIPKKSLEALSRYSWPGNIRELRNLVERAMIISKGNILKITPPETIDLEPDGIEPLDEMQRRHILRALKKTDGRIFGDTGAAKLLGMNPNSLRSRMRKLGIYRGTTYSSAKGDHALRDR